MHPRTARGPVLVLMLFAIGLLAAAQAVAAVTPGSVARPFTVRYAINTNGDIALAANTLMTCPPGTTETQTGVACEDGQDGGLADDNYYPMDYVDVDGVAATVNSSSANARRARRGHRAVRRPLLGRGLRPGRDAAAAVRRHAADGPRR